MRVSSTMRLIGRKIGWTAVAMAAAVAPAAAAQKRAQPVAVATGISPGPVTLDALVFDVESGCNCDYLDVFDGPNDAAPMIGRYNGNELETQGPIVAASGQMYLRWRTDGSFITTGFELFWTSLTAPALELHVA